MVGYLLASHRGTFFANGPVAWVEEIMVTESARGCGIGRVLVEEAESWAASIPVAYVALASRRAVEFYRHLDYADSATFLLKRLPSE